MQRVGVSSTPGKTKHFQTLDVSQDLMLCDCPGLVFPSFMNTTGDMVCSGILPINQMRDCVSPGNIITSRIPQHLLEASYGIHIVRHLDIKDNPNRPPTAHEFLQAYCSLRGYVTTGTGGNWDEFRACKEILRDYNDGKILSVSPPPSFPNSNDPTFTMDDWLLDTESIMMRREKVASRVLAHKQNDDVNGKAGVDDGSLNPESDNVNGEDTGDYVIDPSIEDSYDNADTQNTSESNSSARDHKRLKRWGKKNKKLRDKEPYGEHNGTISYVALSTNRVKTQKSGPKIVRQSPIASYGTPITGSLPLPHHSQKGI